MSRMHRFAISYNLLPKVFCSKQFAYVLYDVVDLYKAAKLQKQIKEITAIKKL